MISGNTIKPGFNFIDREEIHLSGVRKVVLTGDIGCTGFSEDSKMVFDQILRLKTDLIFVLGDLAITGADSEFHEIIDFCNARVPVPVFALPGNHDLPNYKKFFGLATYILTLGKFVFAFLDNSTGFFSDQDLVLLEKRLKKYRGKKFIILMHVPPPTDIDKNHLPTAEWKKLRGVIDCYRESITNIFCAHIHGYHKYYLDGYPVTISAGGGGAMIYDLKKPEQKIYNAIIMTLSDNNISAEVIRIK